MTTPKLKTTSVPLDSLEPWPGNARRGVVAKIKESMRVNGVFHPLDVQKNTRRIIAGNHRHKALLELHEEFPEDERWGPNVDIIEHDVNDKRALKMHLADNKTADDATWDDEALVEQLREAMDDGDSLEGTGFDDDDLEDLIHLIDSEQWDTENPFSDAGADKPDVDDEGFWPKINLTVPPDVFDAWHEALNEHDGADDAVKLQKHLRATGHLA